MRLKLKGQTGSGEWVVFSVSDIEDADRDYTEVRLLNGDNINYILTSTIQLADDPRKAMLKTLRQRLLLESRPVLNDAYEGMLYLSDVNAILDEMEAKL